MRTYFSRSMNWWLGAIIAAWVAAMLTRKYVLLRRAKAQRAEVEPDVAKTVATLLPHREPMTAMEAALADAVAEVQQPFTAATDEMKAEEAAYIGNVRTLVFHLPHSRFLPSEEHRQYFFSEQEALHAGYRRAVNE